MHGSKKMTAKRTSRKQPVNKILPFKLPEILDVGMTARFLTVSADTVYSLFQKGDFPGRKVGRKWITTKSAVLRWVESSATGDTLAWAVERGDSEALAEAINSGKIRVKSKAS
jgi:excisionase family DNA binding protein